MRRQWPSRKAPASITRLASMRRLALMIDGGLRPFVLGARGASSSRLSFENMFSCLNESHGIVRLVIDQHLVMEVQAGRASRAADDSHRLTGADALALAD